MRKSVAVLGTAVLLAALTGCASGSGGDNCTPLADSGDASSTITATGEFNEQPTISFPSPLISRTTERSVLVHGDGDVLHNGDVAVVEITLMDGATGEVLQETGYDGSGAFIMGINDSQAIGVGKGLTCSRVGDRVAVVIPPTEGFSGAQSTQSLVLVADIIGGYPGRATAPAVAAPNGFPNVVYGDDGRPGILVAGATPPQEFAVATLRQGSGETVEEGDRVLAQYTGIIWNTKTVYQSTWEVGRPGVVIANTGGTLAEGNFPGLVGQQVGSQYIVVVPPEQGFGAQSPAGVPANATLVYVVDILGILPGA